MRVVSDAEVIELVEDFGNGAVGVGDGAFGVILALPREALTMFQEFFTVEVGQ
jgi:hypothetical protein